MRMLDQGEQDDKIIAVHCDDPAFKNFTDISELPSHRLAEIKSFFEDYKKNEHKVCGGQQPMWRVCSRRQCAAAGVVHMRQIVELTGKQCMFCCFRGSG